MNQFSWTIEDVAKIQPAPIEEYQPQQYEHAVDSETELKAQEAIDHYFCNHHIVCSPWGPQVPPKTSSLFVEINDNSSADKQTSLNRSEGDGEEDISGNFSCNVSTKKEVSTQTVLTLPPELPPALEAALKPYFIFDMDVCESAEEDNLSTSTPRRKLFVCEEKHQEMSVSPAGSSCFSMQVECKLSSPAHSGLFVTASSRILCPSTPVIDSRTYGTPLLGSKLIPSPEISPIASVHQRNKSVARLNFSSRMMATDNATTFGPSDSPLGMVPIQHEDECCADHKVTDYVLPSSSSAMITSETSTPVKGEAESFSSTSVMITSETSTPVKEKLPPLSEDVSMESLHFKQIQKKLKEFENTDNIVKEGDLTNLNSFSLHSTAENSLSNGSDMHSHDTGYQTGSMSYMTSINGGATSVSSTSKNWATLRFKSVGDRHVTTSSKGFGSDKSNVANKGLAVALDDNLWLPGSRHIISSTPTKSCD
ncbi:protein aurora borealis isoform X2 [Zootermopsis nevadensis]|nr:protein aurora borealis isoform X2 [Zootermopsis nevadensis]